jgi:hypothetical protein
MRQANALFITNKTNEAALLYSRLAAIPLKAEQIELAKKRAAGEHRADSN